VYWGYSERSTYHTTCVNRVASHLKRFCIEAGKERKFVSGRITDAWGYDSKTKTIYFCEIKVNSKDLMKGVYQIYETAFKYTPKDPRNNVIPVIAIPKKLYNELIKHDIEQWKSFRSLCETNKITIWIIEQSAIQQMKIPKLKTPTKTKETTRAGIIRKPKIKAKLKTSTKKRAIVKAKTPKKINTKIKLKASTMNKASTKVKIPKTSKTTSKIKAKAKKNKATLKRKR